MINEIHTYTYTHTKCICPEKPFNNDDDDDNNSGIKSIILCWNIHTNTRYWTWKKNIKSTMNKANDYIELPLYKVNLVTENKTKQTETKNENIQDGQ